MGKASRQKRERRSTPKLYHYTAREHLPSIMAEGVLRTTESNLDFRRADAGPRVVWLLDTPTATDASHGLSYSVYDKTAVRIEVRPQKAVRWAEWAKSQPAYDRTTAAVLARTGGGPEAAAHWWVSESPIPSSEWVEVHESRG